MAFVDNLLVHYRSIHLYIFPVDIRITRNITNEIASEIMSMMVGGMAPFVILGEAQQPQRTSGRGAGGEDAETLVKKS